MLRKATQFYSRVVHLLVAYVLWVCTILRWEDGSEGSEIKTLLKMVKACFKFYLRNFCLCLDKKKRESKQNAAHSYTCFVVIVHYCRGWPMKSLIK